MEASRTRVVLPPLSQEAERLLQIADEMPITIRERDRLLKALGLHLESAWSRVELAIGAEELEGLRWGTQFYTPHDLAHVVDMARFIAAMYGEPAATSGHIAVALAVSSRAPGERDELCDTISSAFRLGTLEEISTVSGDYLEWLEDEEDEDEDGQLSVGYRYPGYYLAKLVPWVDPILRISCYIAVLQIGTATGARFAWLLGFAVLIPTRDRRLVDAAGIVRLPVGLRVKLPLLLLGVVVATVLRYDAIGALMVMAYVALEFNAICGEWIQARLASLYGPAFAALGEERERVARSFRLVFRYPVHDRWIRFVNLILLGMYPYLTLSFSLRIWPIYAAIYLLVARGNLIFALLSGVASLVFLLSNPLLALFSGGFGLSVFYLIQWERRPIAPLIPIELHLPRTRLVSGVLTQMRARKLLNKGMPESAVQLIQEWLEGSKTAEPAKLAKMRMLFAWALLEAEQPGRAWELRDSFPPNAQIFRTLVIGRAMGQLRRWESASWSAQSLLEAYLSGTPRLSAALKVQIVLFVAESEVSKQDPTLIAALTPLITSKKLLHAVTKLFRLTGESAIQHHSAIADYYLSAAGALGLFSRNSIQKGTIVEQGKEPEGLEKEALRAIVALARVRLARQLHLSAESFDQWRNGVESLFRLGAELEAAFELSAMADALGGRPEYRKDTYQCRVDALAVMNATRHDFLHREDRLAWWEIYEPVLGHALASAAQGRDWGALAELIELARMQSRPDENLSLDSKSTPYIRVGGQSCLENAFWQRATVLASACDLENVAETVLGEGTWWWSSWCVDETFYWSLVRPQADPIGGRRPFTEVRQLLNRLQDALPLKFQGESDEQFADRIWESPLLAGPLVGERELSRALAGLLPAPLLKLLRESIGTGEEVALAIAPCFELAHVPWSLIVIDDHDARLVEHSRIAIAPPVALLLEIGGRRALSRSTSEPSVRPGPVRVTAITQVPEILPISGAIVNPGGDLPESQAVIHQLDSKVRILTAADAPNKSRVKSLIGSLPAASTLLFAGHTHTSETYDGHAALYLGAQPGQVPDYAAGDSTDNDALAITSGDLSSGFTQHGAGGTVTRLPAATVLLACGSGDLQNSRGGEWYTLAPAVLWGGSMRAVVTSFPIVDTAETDLKLTENIAWLPLHTALREAQRGQLAKWRETRGGLGAPLHWGGHIAIGSFDATQIIESKRSGTKQRWIDSWVVGVLDAAAETAHRDGRSEVGLDDLWNEVLDWGWEDLPFWRGKAVSMLSLVRNAKFNARQRRAPGTPDQPCIEFGAVVFEVFQDVVAIASTHHHRVIKMDHLIAAMFRRHEQFAKFMRALSGFDPRRHESLGFMLEKASQGWETTGVDQTSFVTRDALLKLFKASGIQVTVPERWYYTDR